MKLNTDFTKVLKKEHERKWVALTQDQTAVVDYADNLAVLRQKLGKGKDEVIYMKVLPSDVSFAF
jgi:hypothetical protein